MGATAKRIADQFIGAAARTPPVERPEVYRRAAYSFMGLAQDPKNVRSAQQLAQIGLAFAEAATRDRPATMDDFTDLLQETALAYDEAGDDPMDLISVRRELHDARTPRLPGFTSIAPESFNKDATLGRSALIKFAPTQEEIGLGILQSQNVSFWQGVKKEAQAMTVDVNLGSPIQPGDPDIVSAVNVRTWAEVEYGSDGNRTKTQFDLNLGTRLTIVGNYCAVTVGTDPPRPGNITQAVTVGASIGAFAAPSNAVVTRTVYVDAITTAASFVAPIPLKAVQLLPVLSDLFLGEAFRISFKNFNNIGLVAFADFAKVVNSSVAPIPVPADAQFVEVTLDVAVVGARYLHLPFQLAM